MSSQRLLITMKHILLLSCLHVTAAFAQRNISCEIPAVEAMAATSLTCTFPDDISLSRQDFSVIHTNNKGKAVLDCLWVHGILECFNTTGYTFNNTVTNQLIIWIPHAFPNMTGDYYCKVSDSTGYNIQHCQLELKPAANNEANKTSEVNAQHDSSSLAIGLTTGLVLLAAIIIAVLVFLFYLRRKKSLVPGKWERDYPSMESMLRPQLLDVEQIQDDERSLPTFEEYIKRDVNKLYPNMTESYYFVPPIYFNKTRYKKQSIAGKDVYVPDPTDPRDVQHDGAMQHVLYCLRHMAEQQKERMFVLTQFKYEDYLGSPVPGYAHHSLPMPAGLSEEDNTVDCFDILVVHQRHGVLVGVVKAVNDKDTHNKNNKQETEAVVVSQVSEALKQLEKAGNMIKYLMSDEHLEVKYTLILPNLSKSSLGHALKVPALVQKLRDYLRVEAKEDPVEMCLCAEHLSDVKTPWSVSPDVLRNIQQRWGWTTEGEDSITRDQYVSIIARFFGPATISTLQVPNDFIKFQLPKTLAEAVSLTGELYERSMLDQELISRLDEHKACLVGTPNTGKTRMLSLVGGKWLSEGHDVFIVKDTSFQIDSFLSNHLSSLSERGSSAEKPYGRVYDERCDLKLDESITACIQKIIKDKKNMRISIILDVAHLKGSHIKTFCTNLEEKVSKSNLYLWVSCTGDECPPIGYCELFTEIVNCPPAVVRELAKVKVKAKKKAAKHTAAVCPPPTDGPPVKYFTFAPNDSLRCGQEVGRFLAEELLIGRAGHSRNVCMQMPGLSYSDVLILFEKEDKNFLEGLGKVNIAIQVAEVQENNVVFDRNEDSALAMNVREMETYREKRKIVLYIENHQYLWRLDKNNKQRALTSCTSQLILVHQNKK
ncbi:uncharacterized protein LOC112576111 [Pomacea canaliculata]|uniref:uncharacterized protein LOC112576111 n=1 Tax=Pomacea canaliculata TaxID=400727 RepID=UPI000D7287EA|nr:uncharacterized protein LOC112576111 [Pomacea canaliculata]XP_025114145.1 uncharacterized protein LOC112576111 [Pomacea canaliculata]XP_025114146.1 uncharacterized protein LOC112576111 [Pomacea canaliculata]